MRISDWSSDVCSSDLQEVRAVHLVGARARGQRHVEAFALAERNAALGAVDARAVRGVHRRGGKEFRGGEIMSARTIVDEMDRHRLPGMEVAVGGGEAEIRERDRKSVV